MNNREKLSSRLGFILLSAGCAIGVGNVWKFPCVVGENGGGIFVLFYLLFLVILGVPIMTMEFAMGRAAQKSPVKMYDKLAPNKSKWFLHGYASLFGNVVLMMFYVPVAGWMLQYFYYMLIGKFESLSTQLEVSSVFTQMISSPIEMFISSFIVILIGFVICSFDMKKGLESITKVMMVALLLIMIVIAVNGLFLDGAKEGISFYLKPNLENAIKNNKNGLLDVIVAAMNQSFFTLSIGIGSMAIFGSFIDKKRSLLGESVTIAVLDTFVAITSGLIIFPACLTYGIKPEAGHGLVFETLPHVFNNLWAGRLWGTLFFVFMTFASLSTVLAVFQNIISCIQDLTSWTKKQTCLISGIAMTFLVLPCILGFNVLKGKINLGGITDVMGIEDYIVSNILLPLGSLIIVLFCTHKKAWGFENFTSEANTGKGLKIKPWMKFYMSYILPIIISIILIMSIVSPFI